MLLLSILLMFQSVQTDLTFSSATLFTIKGEYSNGEVMQAVEDVEVFPDGSFLIHEFRTPYLHYLNREGKYIQQVGRSGRGPGEFTDIWDLSMVGNKVLVTDRRQYKVTEIDPDMNVKDIARIKHAEEIGDIIQDSEGNIYAVAFSFKRDLVPSKRMIFKSVVSNFNYSGKQLAPVSTINDATGESPERILTEVFMGGHRIKSLFNDRNEIVSSYIIYDGKMRVYSPDTGEMVRKITTGDYGLSSVRADDIEIKTFADANSKGVSARRSIIDGDNFSIKYQVFNKSLALGKLNDGRIIHFVQKKEGRSAVLVAEIFDPSATELLDTITINELGDLSIENKLYQHEDYARITLSILKVDRFNRMFVAGTDENGESELHLIQIDL